jgi:hypothetical protein
MAWAAGRHSAIEEGVQAVTGEVAGSDDEVTRSRY